jgi:multiple sugar transport system permease protein
MPSGAAAARQVFGRPSCHLSRRATLGIGVASLFVIPLVWMMTTSLRPAGLPPPTALEWWPPQATLANYPAIFRLLPLGRYTLNSLIVVALAVPLTLLSASWAGFAMAQLSPRTRNLLAAAAVASLLVPVMALWLTRFLIFKWLGVLDSLYALILPAVFGSSPLFVLILYWACRRIPAEVYEAARLDGCGPFRAWWSIAVPLVRPALAAVAVLSFEGYWSNFVDPLLYISDQVNFTLPIGIQALQQLHQTSWPLLMAGSVVLTLPMLVLFIVAQRYFLHEHRGTAWLGR